MVIPNLKQEDLDWVKLREDMDALQPVETMFEKAKRKFQTSPFIPIGKYNFKDIAKIFIISQFIL